MNSTQRGFTLIELLVAVLIIGILAAIALPQYEKAVEKSRSVEGLLNLQTIHKAQQLYKLMTGEDYQADTFDKLDIEIPGLLNETTRTKTTKFFRYVLSNNTANNAGTRFNYARRQNNEKLLYAFVENQKNWYCCWAEEKFKKICLINGFKLEPSANIGIGGTIGCYQK
jgi:prepilin-type N-terminal cleavage/methylation domain-containing protein